jgi:hypothetical protein
VHWTLSGGTPDSPVRQTRAHFGCCWGEGQSTHQEPTEDNIPRTYEDDTFRTCGPEGQSQPPPGFAPVEGADLTEDGEVLGISTEEQL